MKTNVKTTILKGIAMIASFIIIFLSSYVYGQSIYIDLSVNGETIENRFQNTNSFETYFDTLTINIHDELGIYNILPQNDSNSVTNNIFTPSYTNSDATFYNCDSIFEPNNNGVRFRFSSHWTTGSGTGNKDRFEPCDYNISFSDTVTIRMTVRINNTSTQYVLVLKVVDPDAEPVASIDEHVVSINDIKVYPNPVVDYITIDFTSDMNNVPVMLYSLSGELLEVNNDNRFYGNNSVRMDVYDYPKGIYLVKIGNETRKIVKQ